MRRRANPKATALKVPPEIAEGPRVSRWADPRHLAKLADMPAESEGRGEQVQWTKLSALRRHWVARYAWAEDAGISERLARQLAPYRAPYFDPPGTPKPRRTGYAAEPAATDRSWHSIMHPDEKK